MNSSLNEHVLKPGPAATRNAGSTLDRFLRRQVLAGLQQFSEECLLVHEDGEVLRFGTEQSGTQAEIEILDPAFYRHVALGGSNGAAEAYMQGLWRTPDLTRLVQVMARNQHHLDKLEGGSARIMAWLNRGWHWLNRNNPRGSRKNIAAHYDLGNDLFELMLDETMMYSSAVFERPGQSLAAASRHKLDRICRKLKLGPQDHVVEIGSGWGGFAIHAAEHYGCRVTTTTISQEQYDYARERIAAKGLQDRIELRLDDYRDLRGQYDKLVSIEMIEAVGHQYLDTYLKKCSALLKSDGAMLLQAITIADDRYDQAVCEVDFIKRYIFPGSFIPSVTAICRSLANVSDLRLTHLEDIGLHYAETLRLWRQNFFSRLDTVRQLGYDERFIRMWEFYLCYCEGGFRERTISNVHMLLTKPRCRQWSAPATVLP